MLKTKAIIHEKYGKPLFLDDIIINDPKPDEVVIKLYASGICGSQLININNKNLANPELLGHEGTGIVIQAGENIKHVREGDDVLVSWMPYNADKNTQYAQWCEVKWGEIKIKSIIFTWAEHAVMHSQFVSKMEKNFEKYSTSIIGCAGIAGYGTVMNTVNIIPGQSAAVFGLGGLGLLAVNAANNFKANPIIAVDIDDKKLEFSRKFGATHLINSKRINPVEEIKKITNGGADFVFDMVGNAGIREQTILSAREGVPGYCQGGTIVLVGFPTGMSEFNPRSILMGQRTYKGSRGGACVPKIDFPLFYQAYQKGELLLDEVVTNRYKAEDINEALSELSEGKILGRAIIEFEKNNYNEKGK